MKEDTLSYIRDNKEITFEQKIRLVIMLSLPTILAQVSSIKCNILMRLWSEDWGQAVRLQ